jgi:prophage DNA circulation protein
MSNDDWRARLRPASFRGVPFAVLGSTIKFGRNTALHEYPYRDIVWIEDLGRQARRVSFSAFVVGDDCIERRRALMDVCESPGAVEGELIHPTLGALRVALQSATSGEYWDKGRVFEFALEFCEQGQRIFPAAVTQPAAALANTGAAKTAISADFVQSAQGALQNGLSGVRQTIALVRGVVTTARRAVNDATSLYNSVQSLPGQFGRYIGGQAGQPGRIGVTLASLAAAGTVGRANVDLAAHALQDCVGALSTSGNRPALLSQIADSAHRLSATLASAAPSSNDAVRVLGAWMAAVPAGGNPLAIATANLCRRAALINMTSACSLVPATSQDAAFSLRDRIIANLDAEMQSAANAGQDASFAALRQLHGNVVAHFAQSTVNLRHLRPVSTALAMPSLALSQRLYQGAGGVEAMLTSADVIHPAFMPVGFLALT